MKNIFLISIAVLILLNSCATIMQGSKQPVVVTAEPSTAKIYIDDEYFGTGYVIQKLKRNKSHTIMVKQDEYLTRYMTIDNHLQAGWLITDLLLGILPLAIDAGTGSWHSFDKEHYILQLDKK